MKLLALTGALILTAGLAGCGVTAPVGDSPAAPGTSGSGSPNETGSSEGTESSGGPEECGGLGTAELTEIFGADLDGPEPSVGNSNQNGTTWTSAGCDWENAATELEIDLDISGAADFPGDAIICIEPGGVGEVTPVDGLGTQAWWKFDDFDEVEGELRVCTDDALVRIAIDAQSGSVTSDDLREKVTSAIRIVID